MGKSSSKAFNESLAKNQETMQEFQKVQLERQIQLNNQIRERLLAMQIARTRELFLWVGSFYLVATVAMVSGYRRTRKPGILLPIVPLSWFTGYQADMAYGSKLQRIRMEAEIIMDHESELLQLPKGLPSPSTIDGARIEELESRRLMRPHDLYL